MPCTFAVARVPAGPAAGDSDIAAVRASVRVSGRTIARSAITIRPVATHVDHGLGALGVRAGCGRRSSVQR